MLPRAPFSALVSFYTLTVFLIQWFWSHNRRCSLLNRYLWPTSYVSICVPNITQKTSGHRRPSMLNTQLNTVSLQPVPHSVSLILAATLRDISTPPMTATFPFDNESVTHRMRQWKLFFRVSAAWTTWVYVCSPVPTALAFVTSNQDHHSFLVSPCISSLKHISLINGFWEIGTFHAYVFLFSTNRTAFVR